MVRAANRRMRIVPQARPVRIAGEWNADPDLYLWPPLPGQAAATMGATMSAGEHGLPLTIYARWTGMMVERDLVERAARQPYHLVEIACHYGSARADLVLRHLRSAGLGEPKWGEAVSLGLMRDNAALSIGRCQAALEMAASLTV